LWWEIQTYTSNYESTFVSDIPTFVTVAEERVYVEVPQLPASRKNQLGNLSSGNKYLTLPPDWLSTFELAIIDPATSAQYYLIDKDTSYIREVYPLTSYQATPLYYAQYDYQTLILGPTPDQNYLTELHYKAYPVSITVNAGVGNWLANNFAEVLLWGALREAYIYMKGEPDIIKGYEDKYAEAVMGLKKLVAGQSRREPRFTGQTKDMAA
jgi:hypothetical protein